MKRVISVWLPVHATDRVERTWRRAAPASSPLPNAGPDDASRKAAPLATWLPVSGGQRVACANGAALKDGVHPGQRLADARALLPGLKTIQATPEDDQAALGRLADWTRRYTPWTAIDDTPQGSGRGLWLDISGCAHLFGGESALLADLMERLARAGYTARAAAADTPGAAWAVARHGLPTGSRWLVVPPAGSRSVLAPLPMGALRLGGAVIENLHRVGLRRIGDLYEMPRAPLTRRFGPEPGLRLDQALGVVGEPLSPRREQSPFADRLAFAEPIGRKEDLEVAAQALLVRLCQRLERERLGVRHMLLRLERTDGRDLHVRAGTSRPVRDAGHLLRLLAEKLDGLDAGFGIEAMALLLGTEGMDTRQEDLNDRTSTRGEAVERLVDRLANHLGPNRVTRPQPVASHMPERAVTHQPRGPSANGAENGAANGSTNGSASGSDWDRYRADSPLPPRPLRLLPQPWPIQVVAPVPDGPPAVFSWQRRSHRVVAAEGPERIAPEWWRALDRPDQGQREMRDYYRVEDDQGNRFWLFRLGLYGGTAPPRWYLHGIFG